MGSDPNDRKSIGENVAVGFIPILDNGTSFAGNDIVKASLGSWMLDRKDQWYNCEHYLQIVWRDTAKIGYAYQSCPSKPPPLSFVVCCYYGIYFNSSRPYDT